MDKNQNSIPGKNRRDFIQKGIQIVAATSITGTAIFGCKGNDKNEEKEYPLLRT